MHTKDPEVCVDGLWKQIIQHALKTVRAFGMLELDTIQKEKATWTVGQAACRCIIIIIMYIYHVLINALNAHTIHINLNTILYTHIEHSPTETIYIRYYIYMETHTHTHTHTCTYTHNDDSRNWVLILVGMEIL